MSTFIVRVELHPSDREPAYSAVHDAMKTAGFSRLYRHDDGRCYHLPASEYCLTAPRSVEAVRDLALSAVGRISTLFMVLVSETTRIAIAGLVPVAETILPVERPPSPPVTAKAA
jgi:hypothetical protein